MSSDSTDSVLTSGNAKASSLEEVKELIQEARKEGIRTIRVQLEEETSSLILNTQASLGIVQFERVKNSKNMVFEITFK